MKPEQKETSEEKNSPLDFVPMVSPNPSVVIRPVTDAVTLDQDRLMRELIAQTNPLAKKGTLQARQHATLLQRATARPNGLTPEKAMDLVTAKKSVKDLLAGAFPESKMAEVVGAWEYKQLQAGKPHGIVNPPKHVARNIRKIRISPDNSCKRDILFQAYDQKNKMIILLEGGQFKTGRAGYVASSLVKMSQKDNYGLVGIIDQKFVNADGSPKTGLRAFTKGQARQLQEAGIRLRGVRGLEKRGKLLTASAAKYQKTGKFPVDVKSLQQLQADIANAYEGRTIIRRTVGGAGMAAAGAAIASVVVQLVTEGKIDLATSTKASLVAAASHAANSAADAAIFHGAQASGMAPELAKEFAKHGVQFGLCLIAVGLDLHSEFKAYRRGEVNGPNALAGSGIKTALNVLPFLLTPLGLAALPIAVVTQIGGRIMLQTHRQLITNTASATSDLAEVDKGIMALTKSMENFDAMVNSAARLFPHELILAKQEN